MPDEEYWILKVISFLHDPPYKPWIVTGKVSIRKILGETGNVKKGKAHEQFSRVLLKEIGVSEEKIKKWLKLVKDSDHWAAGADRPPISVEKNPHKIDIVYRHPVSGEKQKLEEDRIEDKIRATLGLFKGLSKLKASLNWRELYFFLWRFLPYLIAEYNKDHYVFLWPADTRWCDHSLWSHLDLTAAFAGARYKRGRVEDASLLYIKIPGPQRLISGSKKYKELWGASHLMAMVTLQAIKVISEELGPDSIVYPSLRGNPLFDAFCLSDLIEKARNAIGELDGNIRNCLERVLNMALKNVRNYWKVALIPNKIIAIVPESKVEKLKKEIEKEIEGFLNRLLNAATKEEKEKGKVLLKERFRPRIYHVKFDENLLKDLPEELKRLKNRIDEHYEKMKKRGEVYKKLPSAYYEVFRRFLEEKEYANSRLEENGILINEGVPRSSCERCGEHQGIFKVKIGERERLLCPICLIKIKYREIMRELEKNDVIQVSKTILSEMMKNKPKFTSHAAISLGSFFEELEKKIEGESEVLNEIVKVSKEALKKGMIKRGAIDEVDKSLEVNSLTDLVGNVLENLEKADIEDIFTVEDKIKKILRDHKIVTWMESAKHYSMIKFDGDNIGKLLSRKIENNFEKFPSLAKYSNLSEEAMKYTEGIGAVPGPAYHREISQALINFSMKTLEELEKRGKGHKIRDFEVLYSGGDDLLMISSIRFLDTAIKVLYENFGSAFSLEQNSEKVVMPSWKGTSSITFAHYSLPFDWIISYAAEGEELGKSSREEKFVCFLQTFLHSGPAERGAIANQSSRDLGIVKIIERIEKLRRSLSKEKDPVKAVVFSILRAIETSIPSEISEEILWVLTLREIKRKMKEDLKKISSKIVDLDIEDESRDLLEELRAAYEYYKGRIPEFLGEFWEETKKYPLVYNVLYEGPIPQSSKMTKKIPDKETKKRVVNKLSQDDLPKMILLSMMELYDKYFKGLGIEEKKEQGPEEFFTLLKQVIRALRWREV